MILITFGVFGVFSSSFRSPCINNNSLQPPGVYPAR
ncbi:hypothetical protein jk0724 [Corynebacterium jeikeium K411]|uniref:Uncharacterized protein n=1 Tax=Corynebacterium jeikeium (strain K411) TaxID=306537 RepID=Q4JWC1_CORJK|nr:hypothetical protein jk0724 [Corynebacterium jeikeium K411]